MALTALAALLGTGAEPAGRGASATGPGSTSVRDAAAGSRGERLSQLPLPTVVGAAATAQSASGAAPDLPPTGAQALAPPGLPGPGDSSSSPHETRLLEGGSGRAPPVPTRT